MRFLKQGKDRLEIGELKTMASVAVISCSSPFPTSSPGLEAQAGMKHCLFFFFNI